MTAWLVLAVGLFWALLCGLTKHEQGRVRRAPTAVERFVRAFRELESAIGAALLPVFEETARAFVAFRDAWGRHYAGGRSR